MACEPIDVVQKQVEAYNRQDLAGFVATYAADAALYDHPGSLWIKGEAALREQYGRAFKAGKPVTVGIRNRMASGDYVIDEEIPVRDGRVTGQGVAIYQVKDCRIVRVDFLPQQDKAPPKPELPR